MALTDMLIRSTKPAEKPISHPDSAQALYSLCSRMVRVGGGYVIAFAENKKCSPWTSGPL